MWVHLASLSPYRDNHEPSDGIVIMGCKHLFLHCVEHDLQRGIHVGIPWQRMVYDDQHWWFDGFACDDRVFLE